MFFIAEVEHKLGLLDFKHGKKLLIKGLQGSFRKPEVIACIGKEHLIDPLLGRRYSFQTAVSKLQVPAGHLHCFSQTGLRQDV